MRKPAAIPAVSSGNRAVDKFAAVVKQNMDWLTGQQTNSPALKELPETATLAEVIAQQNRIVQRLG